MHASFINKGPATVNAPDPDQGDGAVAEERTGAVGRRAGLAAAGRLHARPVRRRLPVLPLLRLGFGGVNQTVSFDLPVKLTTVRKMLPAPPQGFSCWPPCGADCIPKVLEVSAAFLQSGTPLLDPDRTNNRTILKPVTLCGTNWTVSEPAQDGEFTKLRCGP